MRTKEALQACGFLYDGYLMPELTSLDVFPQYVKQAAEEAVVRIDSNKNKDSVMFAFMSDIHYFPSVNHFVRLERTLNAYRYIQEKIGADMLVIGGDHTIDGNKEYKKSFLTQLRMHFKDLKYFPINGNHDDGTIWDKAFVCQQQSTNHLTHDEMYNLFYDHVTDLGAQMESEALYYFLDDATTKTRFVFLDSGDIPYLYENEKLRYIGQDTYAYSQKQLDWLINKALVFSEEGWHVIFFSHTVSCNLKNYMKPEKDNDYMMPLFELVDTYKKGEKLNKIFYEKDFEVCVNVDFSNVTRAEVVAFFAGHFHVDRLDFTREDIPLVIVGNTGMYNSPGCVRTDGDKTELLFDVVTVNYDERKIYLTRVGCGTDRVVVF